MDKRSFLKSLTMLSVGGGPSLDLLEKLVSQVDHLPAEEVAKDEDFWLQVRGGYKLKPDYINLESGYYSIMPQETLENFIQHVRDVNYEGAYYMRTVLEKNKRAAAAGLARLAGCSAEELIITRNTTESLDMVIAGQSWTAGDEAVMSDQDYGAMLNQFKMVAKRYGVVNKIISIPNNPKTDEEIVELYSKAITPRTKLLMVGHMINITGQILPVRKICDMAHGKNVAVMVDGAHAFAHIQFAIPDLNCDYYAASLHKWLSVPLGAGILYAKKENISKVWPLMAEDEGNKDDIYQLNHIGTHPAHTDLTIANAIDYYQTLGPARKEARLRYLQNYWVNKVRSFPKVIINTPEDPARSCGIANVKIRDMTPAQMAETFLNKYKIYTVAINRKGAEGCRITPNLFTTTQELDSLVKALSEMGG